MSETIEKMNGKSMDLENENIEKLKELFPNIVSDGKINFDMLRAILGDEVEESREKYQFTWSGKTQAIKTAQLPSSATLRPCQEKSKNWNSTKNLYIEGDNLEVLKQLQKTYHGKIKMIYIDPPYNTGHDFVYKDDYKSAIKNYEEQTGQELKSNPETSGRFHTDWLNMMYPRLILSRNLLRDDGAIFISIDDNEEATLKQLCSEIFGESNFVANISWQRTYSIRNDSKGIPAEVEHILVYCKNSGSWVPNKLERTEEMNKLYKNPDNDPKGLWRNASPYAPGATTHQGMVYAIQHPFTGNLFYPSDNACWRYAQDQMLEYMNEWCEYELKDLHDELERAKICRITASEVRKGVKAIVLKNNLEDSRREAEKRLNGVLPRFYFTNNGKGGIARKVYLEGLEGRTATNFWPFDETGHTDEATKELKKLFNGTAPFDTPKPSRLISRILNIGTDNDDLVLDFFSGSATTADAVMQSNCSGKCLNYILIQIPEISKTADYDTLCDIGEERIRRAGEKLKKEWEERQKSEGMLAENDKFPVDIGFKVFKLDSSNIETWDNERELNNEGLLQYSNELFKEGRSKEDVLYEIMLKYGIFDREVSEIGINGKTMYQVGKRYMIVCLEDDLEVEDIVAIGEKKPNTVVFKESGFKDDNAKINAVYNLKKQGVEDIKCI